MPQRNLFKRCSTLIPRNTEARRKSCSSTDRHTLMTRNGAHLLILLPPRQTLSAFTSVQREAKPNCFVTVIIRPVGDQLVGRYQSDAVDISPELGHQIDASFD